MPFGLTINVFFLVTFWLQECKIKTGYQEMSEDKLKTAVLGLDERGQLLLKAASQIDYFHIEAVADKNTHIAEKIAAEYKCTYYDDYRQLITGMDSRLRGNDIRCLLVASAMHNCDEYVHAAIKKKFHIFKLAPAARNFEEAAELVQLAEEHDVKFAIANLSRFAESFLAFRDLLQKGEVEHVFLIKAFCNVGAQPQPAWQSDPKLSGGGVLLRNCYEIIDQIMWNFPIPQHIYSLTTNQAGDKKQRLYLTEDTAVVTMKFDDILSGSLITFQRTYLGPGERFLKIYCKNKIVTVSSNQLTINDDFDRNSKQGQYSHEPLRCMKAQLKNFALSILSPDENNLCSSGRENLNNMAVIESAYLSARTGFPEEPDKILSMHPRQVVKPTRN